MKFLSFVVPCYNSAAYMEHAVESILVAGEDVEIIIVNDGSTDATSEIAHRLEREHPTIIRAVDKTNGGHGDAVMMGLMHATGLYFKVVDSDDWVDAEALRKVLRAIKDLYTDSAKVDMILSNYVYEKEGVKDKAVIRYRNVFPEKTITTWDTIGRFHLSQYILMHSVIYRTDLLKDSEMTLPRHTFYVDNIYVYYPLPFVQTIYYLDVDFYRYYIGREDQSVNEKVMISRVDQQIKVTKLMIDMYDLKTITNKNLKNYMIRYLAIMMTVSSILLIRSKEPDALDKKRDLWRYLKKKQYATYLKIRYGILGQTMNLPGRPGRRISVFGYKVARRMFGFN